MADVMMLLVALVAFAALVIGWMVLPDASQAESAPVAATTRMAEAA
ncbi:MAG TPA: hypothetical protein VK066_19180 [Chloroflexota bacterium]|nr:hypothetical protein [Chloroflexota bacterium]